MNIESQIKALEEKVAALIADEAGFFLVEIRIKPTNNVKVFIDGDQGISIEKLVALNRKLYKDLEESSFFPGGDFSLEVSSPGLDEPLKLFRQYRKNIGRPVEVQMVGEGIKKEGKLVSVTEEEIMLEEEKGKNKKKEIVQHIIPFDQIKTTKIQIKF